MSDYYPQSQQQQQQQHNRQQQQPPVPTNPTNFNPNYTNENNIYQQAQFINTHPQQFHGNPHQQIHPNETNARQIEMNFQIRHPAPAPFMPPPDRQPYNAHHPRGPPANMQQMYQNQANTRMPFIPNQSVLIDPYNPRQQIIIQNQQSLLNHTQHAPGGVPGQQTQQHPHQPQPQFQIFTPNPEYLQQYAVAAQPGAYIPQAYQPQPQPGQQWQPAPQMGQQPVLAANTQVRYQLQQQQEPTQFIPQPMQQIPPQQVQPQQTLQQPQQQQQNTLKKREKKILAIIDPHTNEAINLGKDTTTPSTTTATHNQTSTQHQPTPHQHQPQPQQQQPVTSTQPTTNHQKQQQQQQSSSGANINQQINTDNTATNKNKIQNTPNQATTTIAAGATTTATPTTTTSSTISNNTTTSSSHINETTDNNNSTTATTTTATTSSSTSNKQKENVIAEFSLNVLRTLNQPSQPQPQQQQQQPQSGHDTTTSKHTVETQQKEVPKPQEPITATAAATTTTTAESTVQPSSTQQHQQPTSTSKTVPAKEAPKTAISTGKNTPPPQQQQVAAAAAAAPVKQQTPPANPPPQQTKQEDQSTSKPTTTPSTTIQQQENEKKDETKIIKDKDTEKADETTKQITKEVLTSNEQNTTTNTFKQQVSLELQVNSEDPQDTTTTTTNSSKSSTLTTSATDKQATMKERHSLDSSIWTPEQQDAKKRYDREFLISMQNRPTAIVKPKDLPIIPNVILDDVKKITPQSSYQGSGSGQYGGKHSYSKGSHDGGRRQYPPHMTRTGSTQGGGRQVIELPRTQDLNINRVENPYKISINDPKINELERILRSVRAILNKLTPQNFTKLAGDLIKLEVNSQEERLKATIDIIFDKAIDEPKFSQTYAELCHLLSNLKLAAPTGETARPINFRSILLTRCQKEFDSDYNKETNYDELSKSIEECTDEKKKAELTEELNEKLSKAKRRTLGNIRFIGELFKLGMLTEVIMHDCIRRLLKQETDEESLECLCRLLTTIGLKIDTPKQAKEMKQHFDVLSKLVDKQKQKITVSARIRFMILDVIELRQSNWVPRRQDNAPKTIDEIRREAQAEEIAKQAEIAKLNQDEAAKRGQKGQMKGAGYQQAGKSTSMDATRFQQRPNIMVDTIKQITSSTSSQMCFGPPSFNKGVRQPNPPSNIKPTGGASNINKQSDGTLNKNVHNTLQISEMDRRASMPVHSNSMSGPAGGGGGGGGASGGGVKKPYMHQHSNEGKSNLDKVKQMNRQSSKSEMSSEASSRDASLSRIDSRDESMPRSNTPKDQIKISRPTKNYTADEIERKSTVLIEEYLQNDDVNETLREFEEFNPVDPEQLHDFLRNIVQSILERSETARTQTGKLFYNALKENKVEVSAFVAALKTIFEGAEDTAIDVPKIADYLGELISPLIQLDFQITFLRDMCQPIIESEICAKIISRMLHKASNRLGHTTVLKIIKSSNLNLKDFFKGVDNLQEYLKAEQLEWILVQRERTQSASISGESYENLLYEILQDSKLENEQIFDQIENQFTDIECKSKQFVRALMSTVCRSCLIDSKVDPELFKKRVPILSKYIERNDELELESLFAVQALDHKLQHQSGFIRVIFDMLYDEDIISEEAFRTWHSTEREDGHKISVLSLKAFFDWLDETEASEN